jgi:ABC-type phosphate transport system substrate-binding protein
MFIYMNKFMLIFSYFLVLSLGLLSGQAASAQPETLTESSAVNESQEHVIANPSIKTPELSLNELRAIFSLRARQWPDGTSITVFVLRDEKDLHRQFLLKTLKMLPHQLRRQWDRYIYSGIGQGPVVVESQEEMLNKVKSTPGGIGYIEGGVPNDQVLMLSIR